MTSIIFRNGLYGGLFLIGIAAVQLLFLGIPDPEDYRLGEIIGYTSIVLSLLFVFFGIRQYRDEEKGGYIGFWKAVGIGLAIAAFPALAFALYNIVYVKIIDPEFLDKYTDYMLQQASHSGLSGAELTAYQEEIVQQQEMFGNPLFQFFIMFLTVFLIGAIISLISALVLRRSPQSKVVLD